MSGAAVTLAAISAFLAIWSYLVYPVVLRLWASRAPVLEATAPAPASVEVLVSAADEENVIADRVVNLLSQEASGTYGVAIGCDGSSDRTARAAEAAGAQAARAVRV